MNPLINSLIKLGNTLAKSQSNREIVYESVKREVHDLLEKLENPQLPASFPDSIIPNVIDKIQDKFQTIIKHDGDNASKYKELAKVINDWKIKKQSSLTPSVPEQLSDSPTGDSTQNEISTIDDHQFEQLSQLTIVQMKCLFSWGLFSPGVKINKRELIYWWIGMDLIDSPMKGGDLLAKFVENRFIECTVIGNNKLCNNYKMSENVHSKVVQAINNFGSFETDSDFWSIMKLQQQQQQQQLQEQQQQHPQPAKPQRSSSLSKQMKVDDKNVPMISLVINKMDNRLSGKTFEWFNKNKYVKVLHLGSWDHNPKRYIVVEDIEALKGLKNMGHLTCLSLQGISGIVELPESVYKLDNLKILDLRACPNLESLSEGIESLKQLMHLDLSECYLLDYIPRGIASLTRLRVLKGFVINSGQVGNKNGNGKKNAPSMALFGNLSNLKGLTKLTIRTRRSNFPTNEDFDTLFVMENLTRLGILWACPSSTPAPNPTAATRFPKSVEKLELQAAPENTLSCLLRSISDVTENSLKKLYIRGGQCSNLDMETHIFCNVHTVRLRYLPQLKIHWKEFREFFPKLTRLEVLNCPNLIYFPCDENGLWMEKKKY